MDIERIVGKRQEYFVMGDKASNNRGRRNSRGHSSWDNE